MLKDRIEEVGKVFNVTRERVRQVEAKSIRKLQHPVRSRKLEGFPRRVVAAGGVTVSREGWPCGRW